VSKKLEGTPAKAGTVKRERRENLRRGSASLRCTIASKSGKWWATTNHLIESVPASSRHTKILEHHVCPKSFFCWHHFVDHCFGIRMRYPPRRRKRLDNNNDMTTQRIVNTLAALAIVSATLQYPKILVFAARARGGTGPVAPGKDPS
jgi:hypothetical protein